jgi:hypothetical protein
MGTLSKPHVSKGGIGLHMGIMACHASIRKYTVCHVASIVSGEFRGIDIDVDTNDSD